VRDPTLALDTAARRDQKLTTLSRLRPSALCSEVPRCSSRCWTRTT
jgi:hypothetical protein